MLNPNTAGDYAPYCLVCGHYHYPTMAGCPTANYQYWWPPLFPAIPTPAFPAQLGWECPRCHRVYGPQVSECGNCNLAWNLEEYVKGLGPNVD